MEKVISVNSFIASLPKIRKRRIWNVVIDGNGFLHGQMTVRILESIAAHVKGSPREI